MKQNRINFTVCAIAAGFFIVNASSVIAQTTIYSDNFDIPDTTSLDGSTQTGRHTGLLANNIVGRSGGIQLTISGGQLNLLAVNPGVSAGRMRFHDASNLGNKWDFASGAAGAAILAGGGMSVDFDWTSANNTSGDWVGYSVGIDNTDPALRVVTASTDSGIILRNNGGSQVFDNGAAGGTGSPFAVANLTHHVTLNYLFNSFADGSAVTLLAIVDGNLVQNQVFDWNGNSGVMNMELSSVAAGTRIDNFTIATVVPEPSAVALMSGFGLLFALRQFRRAR